METENIIIRKWGKKWTLPEVLPFENTEFITKHYFYFAVGFRCPKKGEYFVSGAKPQAYKATNDLSTKYLIVEKLAKAKRKEIWAAVPE